jgi:phage gp36-like protein
MYCTKADILKHLSEDELVQLTADSGTNVDDAVVTEQIEGADSEIDSYTAKRYVVPMSPVPARIKSLSIVISIYKLHARRASKVGGINEAVRTDYEDAIAFLRDVASGKAVIDGAITPTENAKTTGGSFKGSGRIFTNDSMSGL